MPVARGLRRLLRVLELEEEQSERALAFAAGELRSLERAREAAIAQDRGGRRLIAAGAANGELADRLSGLEETHRARRRERLLAPRIEDAEQEVEQLRRAHLAKRVERRQAETLIQAEEARDALAADRQAQQALDDWYLNRMHRTAAASSRIVGKPEL
ncbi:MAG TPA: hypothetical protein VGG26_11320 [Terracidiphilus sp.]